MKHHIVTAVGDDRPGIVEELTGHLRAANANVLDSRMVNLRGQFAAIISFEAAAAEALQLEQSLPRLADRTGLRLSIAAAEVRSATVAGLPFRLKTYSLDQPGIVHRFTETLRRRGVNIEELATRQEQAAFAGSPIFTMDLLLTVPATVSIRELRIELETLGASINCDLDFEPA